jgi:DNA-directed RNA polymerase specialized sigma24 family protein
MECRLATQAWLRNDYCQDQTPLEITTIIRKCLSRIRSWPVPRNWSFQDWFDEAKEVATVAAWQAASDYNQPAASAFPCFVHLRILSSLRTRYRQEFLYGFRFGGRFEERSTDSDDQVTDGPASHVEPTIEYVTYIDLINALSKLSKNNRDVIEQLYWCGRTEAEIAISLGISQVAVHKRKQVAFRIIRSLL